MGNKHGELWYNPCWTGLDYGAGRGSAWLGKGVQKLVEDTKIKTSFCCCPGFKLKSKAIAFCFCKMLINWCWTCEQVKWSNKLLYQGPYTTAKTSAKWPDFWDLNDFMLLIVNISPFKRPLHCSNFVVNATRTWTWPTELNNQVVKNLLGDSFTTDAFSCSHHWHLFVPFVCGCALVSLQNL